MIGKLILVLFISQQVWCDESYSCLTYYRGCEYYQFNWIITCHAKDAPDIATYFKCLPTIDHLTFAYHLQQFSYRGDNTVNPVHLKKAMFGNFTTDYLSIGGIDGEIEIDKGAFDGTNEVIKELIFTDNKKLYTADNFYSELNTLTKLQTLKIWDNNLVTLPRRALYNLDSLKTASIESRNLIAIEDYALEMASPNENLDIEVQIKANKNVTFSSRSLAFTNRKNAYVSVDAGQLLVAYSTKTDSSNKTTESLRIVQSNIWDYKPYSGTIDEVFEAVNKFNDIDSLELSFNNLLKVPSYAFKSDLDKLDRIKISFDLHQIERRAFYHLNNLTYIDLDISAPAPSIDEHAFEFENASNQSLVIKVLNYARNGNNFAFNDQSLLSIGRPTELRLGDMTYI